MSFSSILITTVLQFIEKTYILSISCNPFNLCCFCNGVVLFAVTKNVTLSKTPCYKTEECTFAIENSICTNGFCMCDLGYKMTPGGMICYRTRLGDPCPPKELCTNGINNSTCWHNICICKPEKICSEKTLDDIYCKDTGDCIFEISNSVCFKHQCKCAEGYLSSIDKHFCRLASLGIPCIPSNDLCNTTITGSTCNNNDICACDKGFKIDTYTVKCVKGWYQNACIQ